ncbi:MAG: glycosyltransferase [Acidimicrobiales bacterium]
MNGRVAVVVSGFPRLSKTFALNELLALDRRGLLAGVFATKPGRAEAVHPDAARLAPRVHRLAPGGPAEQAAELAGRSVRGVHGYFAHTPVEVAAGAAAELGVPYGFSVHALDARKTAPSALAARARGARCVLACNPDVADTLASAGAAATLSPHGVDLARFAVGPRPASAELALLAVGRLVAKKGFDVLLRAFALMARPARLRIVGEGDERVRLESEAARLGVAGRVCFAGALTHDHLPAEYAAAADVVVAPCVQDAAGDRDGLPNVVLEALAAGRAVVASDLSAIGTAVRHGVNGLLTPPGDPAALAAALDRLGGEPGALDAFAAAGRRVAEQRFELGACTARFVGLLEGAYG